VNYELETKYTQQIKPESGYMYLKEYSEVQWNSTASGAAGDDEGLEKLGARSSPCARPPVPREVRK